MRRPRSGLAGILLGVAVSALAIVLALRWAGWEPLVAALRQADFRILAPAAGVYLVAMVARGQAWWVILGRRASLLRLLAALNEGYLLNNVLPWRMGELGRAVLLGRRAGLTPALVLASIVVERLLDMVYAVGLLLAMAPVAFQASWAPRAAWIGGGAVLVALAALWVFMSRTELVERYMSRLPGGMSRWGGVLQSLQSGLRILRAGPQLLSAFLWMGVSWALAGLEYWVVLQGFVPGALPSWAGLALCVTLLGVALPSAPGYVGVFEASAVAALSVFGVQAGTALGYALVLHALHYGITTLLGALALSREGETLSGVLRALRGWIAAPSQAQEP